MSVLWGADTLTVVDPDTGVTYTYALRVPLQTIRPSKRTRRYVAESIDYTTRQVISIGDGVSEFTGVIRLDEDPGTLLRVLTLAADGAEITYYDSRAAVTHRCMLIAPEGDLIELARDPAFAPQFIEYSIEVRLRKNETGNFDASIPVISQ